MSAKMASFWYRAAETVLVLLALLLPLAFYLRTYDSAMIKTTLFEAGGLALVFAWLFKGMERGRWELSAQMRPLFAPAALLLVWTVLRFLTSPYKLAALPGFLQQALCVSTFLVTLLEFGGTESASRFAGWTLAAAWLSGLYGLAQRMGFDPFIWKGAFGERVFSTLANPDLYGLFLALCLPLALSKILDPERDRLFKVSDLCLLALLGTNAVWTASAEGLFAFLVLGAVSALILPAFMPSKTALRASALSLALSLSVFAGAWKLGGAEFEKNFLYGLEFKRQAWAGAARMISERPLSGYGPGSFFVHFPRFRPPEIIRMEGRHNTLTEHPECQLLELTAELGLIGAALWAWLFGAVLLSAFRARRLFIRQAALGESCVLAGLTAAVLGFLISAQFGRASQFLIPGWLLWPLAGLLGGLSGLARPSGATAVLPLPLTEEGRKRLYAPALAVFAGLLFFPALWFNSDVHHNIAIYYSKKRDWDKALPHYDKVRPGSNAYVMAQYFKGNIYSDSGRPEEALRQYAKVETLAPDYVLVHYQKAIAYAKLGDWKNAAASHERERRLDPLFAQNYAHWAAAARASGDLALAKKAAYGAIALEPKEPSHWQTLSEIYMKEKRLALARRMRRQAARLRTAPADGRERLHPIKILQ